MSLLLHLGGWKLPGGVSCSPGCRHAGNSFRVITATLSINHLVPYGVAPDTNLILSYSAKPTFLSSTFLHSSWPAGLQLLLLFSGSTIYVTRLASSRDEFSLRSILKNDRCVESNSDDTQGVGISIEHYICSESTIYYSTSIMAALMGAD